MRASLASVNIGDRRYAAITTRIMIVAANPAQGKYLKARAVFIAVLVLILGSVVKVTPSGR
jgi:hypothetical protein